MNDFYNVEYLSERVAALAKERDELKSLLNAAINAQESLAAELAKKREQDGDA